MPEIALFPLWDTGTPRPWPNLPHHRFVYSSGHNLKSSILSSVIAFSYEFKQIVVIFLSIKGVQSYKLATDKWIPEDQAKIKRKKLQQFS